MINPILKIENLNKSFGALMVSDDICLDVGKDEIHALIGPNGAGKSTLIAQITGQIAPDNGAISLNGNDIINLNSAKRAKIGLSRTFQISSLPMEFTVLENVMLGSVGATGSTFRMFSPVMKDKQNLKIAFQALERVGIQNLATLKTGELSHGQRRQIEVAVALTLKTKVFLMYEPMAGLGISGTKKMIDLLKSIKNDAPILLVEHDMNAVFALADRISVLVYGKVITTGTVEEIRSNDEVRTAYLGEEE